MKYTVSNTINKPLSEVAERFKDPDGAKEWMEGLTKIEPLKGDILSVGSETNFTFLHKGKEIDIHETVLEQDLPNSVKFAYRSKMGYNEVELKFEEVSPNETRQTGNNMFELKGFMKVMGFFGKGMFKKQSMKYMDGFKAYCEK
jgi:hypothetical protein